MEIPTEEFDVPPPPPQTPLQLVRASLLPALVIVSLTVAMYLLFPHVPHPGDNIELLRAGAYASAAAFFLLIGGLVLSLRMAALWPARLLGIATVITAVAGVAGNVWSVPVATDLAKVLFATSAGFLLAKLMQDVLWAPVSAVAIAAADAWSVYAQRGVSRTLIEQHPETVPWATVVVPAVTFEYGEAMMLGIVDLLFFSMFLVVAWGWGLGTLRNLVALSLSFVATMAIDVELLSGSPVPALPVLALTFIVVNTPAFWRVWRLRRQ